MITHDCLKVIDKNFAVILISLLYLAKFFSKKTANNIFLRPMDPSASQFTETPFRPADSLGKIRFSLSQWLVGQKTYPKMQNRSSTLGLGEMMIDSPPLGAK